MGTVYDIKYQVMENGKRVGFVISKNGENKYISVSELISYIDKGYNFGITKNRRGFKLTNGKRLIDVPIISYTDLFKSNKTKPKGIVCYTGKNLENYINSQVDPDWKYRDIVPKIISIFNKPKFGKSLTVSGLRGTGKTVAMLQALKQVTTNEYADSLYVTITNDSDCSCTDICDYIEPMLNNKKYVVIDEITRVKDLIKHGDVICERVRNRGISLVMSGTDTLALIQSQTDGLYHRAIDINITFISFEESVRTLNYGLVDYIKMGGLYKDEYISDFSKFTRYINTAVVDNILNTVNKNKSATGFELIRDMDPIKLRTIVFKLMYSISFQHIMNNNPKLKTSMTRFNRVINLFDLSIEGIYNTDLLNDLVCRQLGINKIQRASNAEISEILVFLMRLGLVVELNNLCDGEPNKYYFTNPSIINQAYTAVYNELYNLLGEPKETYKINAVYGEIFEGVIVVHALKYVQMYGLDIGYFRNKQGREIDLIIYKKLDDWDSTYSVYYEIKLTSNIEEAVIRTRWLNDTDYASGESIIPTDNSKVIKRYIIYTGKTEQFKRFNNKETLYSKHKDLSIDDIEKLNTNTLLISGKDFMLNPEKFLGELRNYTI